jgi:hypothetical protein
MKSTLDKCDGIILDNLNYQNEGELTIKLIELILSDSRTDLYLGNGKVIKDLTPLEPTTDSRKFNVEFKEVVFYQVVDESYCTWDNYEVRDGKDILQELSKSRYLDFVNENFPFYSTLDKKGKHYRLIASTEVIDVISYGKPIITELKN